MIVDDLSRKDRISRGETSEFHSLLINEIVLIIYDHGSTKHRGSFGEKRELDSLWLMSLKIIVEDESTKDKFIRWKIEVNLTHLWSTGLSRSFTTIDLKTKKSIRGETYIWLTLIDDSLKIIVEDESTKDRDSFEDRDKGTSLTFVGGIVQIILDDWSRRDRGSFKDRDKWIMLTFDRREFGDRCGRWIYKRHRSIRGQRQVNFTHPRSTGSSKTLSTIDLQKKNSIRGETNKLDSLWSTGLCRSFTTIDLEKTESVKETSEFHSPSINESFQIIDDNGSAKDRDSFEEKLK